MDQTEDLQFGKDGGECKKDSSNKKNLLRKWTRTTEIMNVVTCQVSSSNPPHPKYGHIYTKFTHVHLAKLWNSSL